MFFKKGANGNELIYPVDQQNLDSITDSRLVNPKVGYHHNVKIPGSFKKYESLREVQQVRHEVEKGIFPRWFFEKYYPYNGVFPEEITQPLKNEGLSFDDPKGLANVVHMDLPTDMPFAAHKWLLSQGANVRTHTADHINFLESLPQVQEQITDGIQKGLVRSFEVKYYYGLERPEEVYEQETDIDGTLLTAYSEGCPNHPSFTAGHAGAAAGGISSLIKEFPEITEEQIKVLIDTAYIWAQCRTLAGVHHAIDNVGGLIVGGLERYFKPEVIGEYKIQ